MSAGYKLFWLLWLVVPTIPMVLIYLVLAKISAHLQVITYLLDKGIK